VALTCRSAYVALADAFPGDTIYLTNGSYTGELDHFAIMVDSLEMGLSNLLALKAQQPGHSKP
jgi:hypothetical protein